MDCELWTQFETYTFLQIILNNSFSVININRLLQLFHLANSAFLYKTGVGLEIQHFLTSS